MLSPQIHVSMDNTLPNCREGARGQRGVGQGDPWLMNVGVGQGRDEVDRVSPILSI